MIQHEKILHQLRNQEFRLDSLRIELHKNDPQRVDTYSGAGFVEQVGDSQFRLCVYHLDERFSFNNLQTWEGEPGKVIPPEQFYSATVTDSAGRKWSIEQLLPDPSPVFGGGAIVVATFNRLVHRTESSGRSNYSALWTSGSDGIPWTNSTETRQKAFGELIRHRSKLSRIRFPIDGLNVELFEAEPWLGAMLTGDGLGPGQLPQSHLSQALQFALGHRVEWTLTDSVVDESREVVIQLPREHSVRARIERPLHSTHARQQPQDFVRMVANYFTLAANQSGSDWPQMSKAIYSTIEASSGSLQAKALALPVAVEAVLRAHYERLFPVPDEELSHIQNTTTAIEGLDLDKRTKDRLAGALANWQRPSAKSMLRECVAKGLASREEVRAWQSIRNPTVHGDPRADADFEGLIYKCAKTSVLLYKLCFAAIGYQGHYTDYGSLGYPIAKFEGRLPDKP